MLVKTGIGTIAAGFFMALLAGISGFMGKKTAFSELTISSMLGDGTTETIITITDFESVQNILDFIMYETPFYGVLIVVGVIILIVSLFVKNH